MKSNTFKVGDYVRVLDSTHSGLDEQYIKGTVYLVTYASNHRIGTLSAEGYINGWGVRKFVKAELTLLEQALYNFK